MLSKQNKTRLLKVFLSPEFSNNRLQSYVKSILENDFNYSVYMKNPLLIFESFEKFIKDQELMNINKNNSIVKVKDKNEANKNICDIKTNNINISENKITSHDDDDLILNEILNHKENSNTTSNIEKSNSIMNIKSNVNESNNIIIKQEDSSINSLYSKADIKNLISIENPTHNNINPYLIVITDTFKLKEILTKFDTLTKLSKELYLIMKITLNTKENSIILKLKFFLETEYKVKVYFCETNESLLDFFENLLKNIPIKLEKSKLEYYDNKANIKLNTYFNEELNNENTVVWIKQLMCIPGVSEVKAHAIALKYSFQDLVETYFCNESSKNYKEGFLKTVEVVNKKNGSVMKIGEAISKKIYLYFVSKGEDIIN